MATGTLLKRILNVYRSFTKKWRTASRAYELLSHGFVHSNVRFKARARSKLDEKILWFICAQRRRRIRARSTTTGLNFVCARSSLWRKWTRESMRAGLANGVGSVQLISYKSQMKK